MRVRHGSVMRCWVGHRRARRTRLPMRKVSPVAVLRSAFGQEAGQGRALAGRLQIPDACRTSLGRRTRRMALGHGKYSSLSSQGTLRARRICRLVVCRQALPCSTAWMVRADTRADLANSPCVSPRACLAARIRFISTSTSAIPECSAPWPVLISAQNGPTGRLFELSAPVSGGCMGERPAGRGNWGGQGDLNPRPPESQSGALTN